MLFQKLKYGATVLLVSLVAGCASTPAPQVDLPKAQAEGAPSANAKILSEDDYELGQGDTISILVFDEPDLTLDAQVGASGFINYSYLGNLQVAGQTPLQLEQQITSLLRDGYLVNPSVNVSVKEFRPFFIGGEVSSPGSYPYQPGLTLDKAIALAGGLTDRASTRRMFVVRAGTSGRQIKLSLADSVGPGDTVTIQEGFF